jgi:hypothetical protein
MTFLFILTLSVATIEKPMPSDLACNAALASAQVTAARDYPDARFISATCRRES